jgi:GT2 family glycosyltransferase
MTLLLRKLLLAPFYFISVAIDAVGRIVPIDQSSPKPNCGFTPGISVVIPERANKHLLRGCLQSLQEACARFEEPVQTIVVVSEAQREMYEDLILDFQADWIFRSEPLWFVEAVALGLAAAIHDWVYLLNNDMVLDSMALCEVVKWRSPAVFAIASQIYFQDSTRRREETGLTAIRNAGGLLEILDLPPEDNDRICTHTYAGGGSSLFQRRLLIDFIAKTNAYEPFYWEDVEWSVLAWRNGFEVLFCPRSKVWHFHRSTNVKFFSREEIDRIFRRNGLRFQLRMALPPKSLKTIFGTIARLDADSFREMLDPPSMFDTLRARFKYHFNPSFTLEPLPDIDTHYGRPRTPGKPLILVASPYCVYPPAHGGARRIHELIERLSATFDIILLSDEGENYSAESIKYFRACHLVCLLSGRKFPAHDTRIERILSHSHAAFAAQLQALIRIHDPDLVQIEYVELVKLIEIKDKRPWILMLHDVLLNDTEREPSNEDDFELQYINRFDAVITCSPEDRALLQGANVHVVSNGANITSRYQPSPSDGPILFIGPFRYPPNLAGIIEFLKNVYPVIHRALPSVRLWILGGLDARAIATKNRCFDQPGVSVFDFIEDIGPWLRDCSISINPDKGVRGSSLKVIESLAAGRMCVSTREGARGVRAAALQSLVIVDENDFAKQIVKLITDVEYRHRLEAPTEALHSYSWQRLSEEQTRIYRSLLQTGSSTPTYALAQAGTRAR